jgi:myo-inositol-1(or 4)-monophosphatase
MSAAAPTPSTDLLAELERTAVDLARLAAAEIASALGRTMAVRYKGAQPDEAAPRDPVSEVDHRVEELVRARLAEDRPQDDIVGEEFEAHQGESREIAWVLDPIDGTANFVNGFPLFAASIGVLHRGAPVAGAVWCSASHALRAGVYHAHLGGRLRFDHEPLEVRRNLHVRRHLAGDPQGFEHEGLPWDARKTGSAAVECAFVAAGLLRAARFERPNVWDIGGGIALLHAAGAEVRTRNPDGWDRFTSFGAPDELRRWRQPLVIGDVEAVELICHAFA